MLTASLPAQEPTDALWTRAIKKLADSRIRVSRFQGASVTGAFVSATSDDITLRTKQAVTTIQRSEIRKIQRLGGVARLKKAALGGVAGGGVGTLIFANSGGSDYFVEVLTAVIIIGALIGFGVGLAFPASSTVYRATP